MASEWQSAQSSPRLAHKVQKCHRVDEEEESRKCPRTGSERSLPLDHLTGQKSDPNGTLPSTLFASQSFATVSRLSLHIYFCGQVRPALLFVFAINTNLSQGQWAGQDCGLTRESLRGTSATLPGLPPRGCSESSASLGLQSLNSGFPKAARPAALVSDAGTSPARPDVTFPLKSAFICSEQTPGSQRSRLMDANVNVHLFNWIRPQDKRDKRLPVC